MMRRRVVIPALLLAAIGSLPTLAAAQYGTTRPPVADASQRFSATQLDNLTGPVALYPDALLAQVLVAATFPDQVEDAAAFVRSNGTDGIDNQAWDVSVKAVAHYPSALNAMADKIDWTAALGKAYATQSSDVMASVQHLRTMAAQQGNLNTTQQQRVVATNNTYQIVPVEPTIIYVPVYDPYVIYSRPIFNVSFSSRYWSFGVGFPIGGWLIYDCDWGLRRVYYNGWSPSYYAFGGGWRQRSRPYIQVTNIYINTRYSNVYYNRNVITHNVNYYNVDRYASVHSGRYFEGRHDGRYDPRDNGRDTRYASRNDNDNGRAVNGGGYRNDSPGNSGGSSNRGNGNGNGRDDGRDNGSPNTRDGSGYGNGNRGNNGGNGGNNAGDGVERDGNGNRIMRANPRGQPPEQRRNEPVVNQSNQTQVFAPQRRDEPQQSRGDAPEVVAPQRSAERSSGASGRFTPMPQPQQESRRSQPQQQSQPQAPRSVPQPRVESQPASPPQVIAPSRGSDTRSDARTAKARGGPPRR